MHLRCRIRTQIGTAAQPRFCCADFALHRLHRSSIANTERHDGHQ
jgi:hypothetical protein